MFTGQAFLTDFLDPRQRQIMETIAGGEAIVQAFGGYEEAEKCRLYISLEWENLRPDDYQVQLFEIEYAQKFASLRHSQILGSLEEKPLKDRLEAEDNSEIITAVASSMRLDAVLAALSNKSRSQVKEALEAGEVRLNWHEEEKGESPLKVGDILSLRRFGRVKLLSVQPSKKGRLRVEGQFWPAKRQ